MKLVKQIEEERRYYFKMMREANKQNETELFERFSGIVSALDWVRGCRDCDTESIEDFLYNNRFKVQYINAYK